MQGHKNLIKANGMKPFAQFVLSVKIFFGFKKKTKKKLNEE